MSGRHAFSAASNVLSDSKVRTAAAALAAGAMFGAAFPMAATANGTSGSQALADLTVSDDAKNDAAKNSVIANSDADSLVVGQLVVEDNVVADNIDLALEVELPGVADTADANDTQTAATPQQSVASGSMLSAEEAGSLVAFARQFIGTPYVYGGTTPAGFDCSGFVQYVYAQSGISIPRTAAAQGAAGQRISAAEAQPGDVVIWNGGYHAAIYTGNGYHLAANNPSMPLSEYPLWGDYYFVRFAN